MSELQDRLARALADHYTLEREIGIGGMATVYLARDVKHERQVALKVLRPELSSAMGAERFPLAYAKLFGELRRRGEAVSTMDLLIASAAMLADASLVTRNVRGFERIPGLRVVAY